MVLVEDWMEIAVVDPGGAGLAGVLRRGWVVWSGGGDGDGCGLLGVGLELKVVVELRVADEIEVLEVFS